MMQRSICKEAFATDTFPSMTTTPPDGPDPTVHLDARNLRGIAHPVRVRMLALLRIDGPATASALARRLGLNTGATSYHLRQLAAHGFIVEDTARGTARERWWRSAHEGTMYDRHALDSDEEGLGWAYMRAVAELYADTMLRAVDEASSWPDAWRDASTLSDYFLLLAPDELRRLKEEVTEVIARYRRASADPAARLGAPEGATPVAFQIQAFPLPGTLDTSHAESAGGDDPDDGAVDR
jgi:DNA-binding transcriptional ArsR family regulator